MFGKSQSINIRNIENEIIGALEAWCVSFNNFVIILFFYLKYIFVLILLTLGIFTLLKLRGKYFDLKISAESQKNDFLNRIRIILGTFYIFLGFGILLNFFTYFLIMLFDPLPDRLIFNFINFAGNIDPFLLNRIQDISASEYAHEKAIYYAFALISYQALINLIFCFWYFLNNRNVDKPRRTMIWLFSSLIELILFGFTTALPFFL